VVGEPDLLATDAGGYVVLPVCLHRGVHGTCVAARCQRSAACKIRRRQPCAPHAVRCSVRNLFTQDWLATDLLGFRE
ncbi:MAG: hypothetical protein ACPIOQ_21190, partial [Promethearchaeia archaeon]